MPCHGMALQSHRPSTGEWRELSDWPPPGARATPLYVALPAPEEEEEGGPDPKGQAGGGATRPQHPIAAGDDGALVWSNR